MCVSCGCGKLNDDHGDDRHITMSQLAQAAAAAGVDVRQVAQNIQEGVQMQKREEGSARLRRAS